MLANENKKVNMENTNNSTVHAHISQGNRKLGAIPNFSLVPGRTCSTEACKTCLVQGCYACKAYRQYKTVKNAWNDNTELAVNGLEQLEAELNAYFDKLTAPRFFRVHTGGDFVTREYAEMWARVAASHPGTTFLAFTKQWDNVRGVEFPDNFSIVLSGWPGTEIPADLRAVYPVANMIETIEQHDERAILCPGNCDNCGMCFNLKKTGLNVEFLKH